MVKVIKTLIYRLPPKTLTFGGGIQYIWVNTAMVHVVVPTFGGVSRGLLWGGRGGIGFLGQNIKKCQLDSYQIKVVRGGGGGTVRHTFGGG